jgi:hypothetical protein
MKLSLEKSFYRYILTAPIEQLNIKSSNISLFFTQKSESGYENRVGRFKSILTNAANSSCVFCDMVSDDPCYFPIFELNEQTNYIALVDVKAVCDSHKDILQAASGAKSTMTNMLKLSRNIPIGDKGLDMQVSDIVKELIDKRNKYSGRSWTWDLNYLYRRGFSPVKFYNSNPEIHSIPPSSRAQKIPSNVQKNEKLQDYLNENVGENSTLIWSGFSNIEDLVREDYFSN